MNCVFQILYNGKSALPGAGEITATTTNALYKFLQFKLMPDADSFPPGIVPYIYQGGEIDDPYAGYYDIQRCGKCHDYCYWAGPSLDGFGVNPRFKAYRRRCRAEPHATHEA